MVDPASLATGGLRAALAIPGAAEGRRVRKLRTYPLHVTTTAETDGKTVSITVHADNDREVEIEVEGCFIRRHQTTGGCGDPITITDTVLKPVSTEDGTGGRIKIPALSRRSWTCSISHAEIAETIRRELDEAEARIYAPDLALRLKTDRDRKNPSTHPLARLEAPKFKIWGMVKMTHREREMVSKKHCDIPPVVVTEVLKEWWDKRLAPRIPQLRKATKGG